MQSTVSKCQESVQEGKQGYGCMAIMLRVLLHYPKTYETHLVPCYEKKNDRSPSDMSALSPVARHQAAKVSELDLQACVPWPLVV